MTDPITPSEPTPTGTYSPPPWWIAMVTGYPRLARPSKPCPWGQSITESAHPQPLGLSHPPRPRKRKKARRG